MSDQGVAASEAGRLRDLIAKLKQRARFLRDALPQSPDFGDDRLINESSCEAVAKLLDEAAAALQRSPASPSHPTCEGDEYFWWIGNDFCQCGAKERPPASPSESSAERTLRSLATMLGWVNVPPQHVLEAEIRALKARAAGESEASDLALLLVCERALREQAENAAQELQPIGRLVADWPGRDSSKSLAQQIADEFSDFRMVIDHAAHVFDHVTSGRISKPNTDPRTVCAVADDLESVRTEEAVNEAVAEMKDELGQ